MTARSSFILCVLFVVLTWPAACARSLHAAPTRGAPVTYAVDLPDPARQYVHVAMHVSAPRGQRSDVAIPAWTPGSYLIRDFARHVYDVTATDDRDRALPVTRLDKQTWRIGHGGRPFTVAYRVFAADRSVRGSHVDDRHASLLGTSVFAYVVGELDRPCRVEIAMPLKWSAFTALEPLPLTSDDRIGFVAPDYDRLVDAPIELGTPTVRTWQVDGARFELVVTGDDASHVDVDRLAADATAIVTAQGEMMGGFPFGRYVFLLQLVDDGEPVGGGGLEHAASTSMIMRRSAFDTADGYVRAQHLIAHEFFHLWNVKRIHDVALGPFDYARENHSRLLWMHEGLTETVESLSLLRAGLVDRKAWLQELSSDWTAYVQKPGRNRAPIGEVSFEAWIKAYQPAKNHRNETVSYYEKGKLIGIALDLELRLRAATHGRSGSLMGLFRRLMRDFGASGKGITQADVVRAASDEAGEDMAEFFTRYVDGTEELPLPTLLDRIGVDAKVHPPWTDAAGRERPDAAIQRTFSGIELRRDTQVDNVLPKSPAHAAGIMLGDEIVAVDGKRTSAPARVRSLFAAAGPGTQVEIALFRDGRLLEKTMTLVENPARTHHFTLRPEAGLEPTQRDVRQAWLRAR